MQFSCALQFSFCIFFNGAMQINNHYMVSFIAAFVSLLYILTISLWIFLVFCDNVVSFIAAPFVLLPPILCYVSLFLTVFVFPLSNCIFFISLIVFEFHLLNCTCIPKLLTKTTERNIQIHSASKNTHVYRHQETARYTFF